MEKSKSNSQYIDALKHGGVDIYKFVGDALKKVERAEIELERAKVVASLAKQGFNNASIAMRACKYDLDKARLSYDLNRLALAERKFAAMAHDAALDGL